MNFAELVIYRRVINYRIKVRKDNIVLPFTYFEDSNGNPNLNLEKFTTYMSINDTQEELIIFKQNLSNFGISIMDIANNSPKHKDSINLCIKIARLIVENEILFYKFETRKSLPISDILKHMNISRRTIERNRKFIIANILILSSNLEILKEFINNR